jgi:Zn-finger nucleic acid-binding protein
MDCPNGHGALAPRQLDAVTVDECPTCGGIWFDQDELRRAKDAAEPDANWLELDVWKHSDDVTGMQTDVACPNCSAKLAALTYGRTQVRIDHCPNCQGTWLGKGEFGKLVAALHEEVSSRSVPEYLKVLVTEASEVVTGQESLLSEWKDFSTVLRLIQYRLLTDHPAVAKTLAELQRANPFR